MAAVRPKCGVNSPALALGVSTVMLYVILLTQLQAVNAVISYGQPCNSFETCPSPTSCHSSKQCLCTDPDYYYYKNKTQKCEPVFKNQTCFGANNSVICTLEQADSLSITYQVSVNSSSNSRIFSLGRAEIKGVLPGTYYIATISAQIYSVYNGSSSVSLPVWTKPENPKCEFSSEKTVPKEQTASDPYYLYNITFKPPRGHFRNFVIDKLKGQGSMSANKTTITNISLVPGQAYHFIITSYNDNNESSESTKCTWKTSEKASEVRNINITHAPCSTVISWDPPQFPNGKITHYELSASDANGECKWNCTGADTCVESAGTVGNSSVKCSTVDFKFGDRMSVQLLGLEPNKTYSVSIAAYNEAKTGLVATRIITTPVAAASVSNVSLSSFRYATSANARSGKIKMKIRWEPSISEGNISYNVEVKKAKGRQSQDFDAGEIHTVNPDLNGTEMELDDKVLANWNYEARVQAVSCKGGSSWVSSNNHTTAENNPGQVQNLNVMQHGTYASIILVTFDCLNESVHNGILSKYVVKSTFQSKNGNEVDDGGPHEHPPDSCGKPIEVTISEVEKEHKFAVKAVNKNYSGEYSETKILTPKARKPNLSGRFPIIADVIDAKNEGPNIKLKLCVSCLLNTSQGNVENSGLTVCVVGDNDNCGSTDVNYQQFLTWKQAQKKGFTEPYRTTPNDWKDNLRSQPENYTYEVGVDTNCDSNPEDQFCNGPLPEGKRVIISVLVCTKAGCEQLHPDEILVNKRPEKPPSNTVAIVLGVLAALVLICVAAVLVSRRFLMRHIDEPETPDRKPVRMCDFEEYVKKLHKDSDLLMQSEFEDLKTKCMTFKNSCNEAQREANRVKNRFVDILPYDHSRVKLNMQPEEEETNDFINANYIPGFSSVREYIATQGPMHSTIPDFWRMIWEQKSQIIVMVSDLQENGRLKVDQYWPETLHEPVTFENVIVEMTNISQLDKYIVRSFKISKGAETRKVTQFFLPGWCDFGANLSCSDVLEFARLMRQEVTPDASGPITVHCSAGVGRTGTFIALDYFIQYVEKHYLDDEIDIYGYVLKMRKNRPRMVQAEIQYIFIYDAVKEIIRQKIEKGNERQENEGLDNEGESDGNTTLANGKRKENMYIEIQLKDEKCSYVNEAFASDNSTLNRTNSEESNHKQ